MKKKGILLFLLCLLVQAVITGCGQNRQAADLQKNNESGVSKAEAEVLKNRIAFSEKIKELESGLSAVEMTGNYGFEEFLAQGGAGSDREVVSYLTEHLLSDIPGLLFGGNPFGCSTLSVPQEGNGYLFGRNFDWNRCDAMVVKSQPKTGYASISTVNMDFIQTGGISIAKLPDNIQAMISMYAPLDGMNEEGFVVSVNMIQDSDTIEQNTEKPDLTTTTAVRLLLNRAASVEEAVALLQQYDLHASMGMMIHFAMADSMGKSVVIEYVNNEMIVTETPVVTNFYLSEGEKYGIGTSQSHTRYDLLNESIQEKETFSETDVRDSLNSVSKHNFDEYESTEWSIVMNQETKEMTYYHRENYETGYVFSME